MEFQFLGTSSGTPSKNRNVSGLALRATGSPHWSLIDCGEGTQHQILRTNLSLHELRAVFITHMHGDHCYGLPGLLASAGMLNRTAPLTLVGPPELWRFVEGVMATTQLGLPYPLEFVDVHGLDAADVLPDLAVRATALSHRLPSWAYGFTERAVERHLDGGRLRAAGIAPGPAWGQLQRGEELVLDDGRVLDPEDFLLPPRKPRKVIVAGDNDRPELLVDEARTAQVLVHEATYTEPVLQKVGQAPQHSSAAMTAGAASAAGVPNLVLTHFSPRYQDAARREGDGLSMRDLELEARAQYSGRLFLARDFERYALDRKGVLARLD
jgi:ribonuclease Z